MLNTYVDAVLVRRVIIGLGNCSCELFRDLFGELSGDDIFTCRQFFFFTFLNSFSYKNCALWKMEQLNAMRKLGKNRNFRIGINKSSV